MKIFAAILLCLSLCLSLWGCGLADREPAADTTAISAPTEQTAASAEQQLTSFQTLTADSIRALDIVYVRPENGGTRVYKTFTETSDIQAVLDILKEADLQPAENQEPQGGWTLLVRIWPSTQSGESAEPLLISSGGDTSIRIGSYAYTAKSAAYYTDLLAFFETSAAEEKPYTVSS